MKNWISYFALLLAPLRLSADCTSCQTNACGEEIGYIDYTPWEAGDDAGLWCLPGSRCTYSCPSRPSGAEIYRDLSYLCHRARYPSEYNMDQWRTIMLHMRVLMPMTACDYRMSLSFLQEVKPVVNNCPLSQVNPVADSDANKTAQNGDSLDEIVGPVSVASTQLVPSGFAGYASKFNYVFSGSIGTFYAHPIFSFFGDLDGNNSFFYIFEPTFLSSYGDSILLASSIAVQNIGQSAAFYVRYAYVAYVFNDYITFLGGRFDIPFGIYAHYFGNLAIGNLFPVSYQYPFTTFCPTGDIGFEVKGAIPLCELGGCFRDASFTYELWIGNGPNEVNAFSGSLNPSGAISFDANAPNNNNEFTWGCRFAFLPNNLQWYGIKYMRGRWSSNKVAFSFDGQGKKKVFQGAGFDVNINFDPSLYFRGEYLWTQYEGNFVEYPWVRQATYWAEMGVGFDHIACFCPQIYCWYPCFWDRLQLLLRSEMVWSQPSGTTSLGFDYSGFDKRVFTVGLVYFFTQTLRVAGGYTRNYGDSGHNFVREQITGSTKKTGFKNDFYYVALAFGW
jgi:hypothetical protein